MFLKSKRIGFVNGKASKKIDLKEKEGVGRNPFLHLTKMKCEKHQKLLMEKPERIRKFQSRKVEKEISVFVSVG